MKETAAEISQSPNPHPVSPRIYHRHTMVSSGWIRECNKDICKMASDTLPHWCVHCCDVVFAEWMMSTPLQCALFLPHPAPAVFFLRLTCQKEVEESLYDARGNIFDVVSLSGSRVMQPFLPHPLSSISTIHESLYHVSNTRPMGRIRPTISFYVARERLHGFLFFLLPAQWW